MSSQERLAGLQEHCDHAVTLDFCLPIQIIDVATSDVLEGLPPIAGTIAKELAYMSETTLQTLFYAWETGFTTLSSNREALNKFEVSRVSCLLSSSRASYFLPEVVFIRFTLSILESEIETHQRGPFSFQPFPQCLTQHHTLKQHTQTKINLCQTSISNPKLQSIKRKTTTPSGLRSLEYPVPYIPPSTSRPPNPSPLFHLPQKAN